MYTHEIIRINTEKNIHARTKLRGTERGAKGEGGRGGRYGSGAGRFTLLILCRAAYVRTAIQICMLKRNTTYPCIGLYTHTLGNKIFASHLITSMNNIVVNVLYKLFTM